MVSMLCSVCKDRRTVEYPPSQLASGGRGTPGGIACSSSTAELPGPGVRPGSHQQRVRSSLSGSCYSTAREVYKVMWWCSFLRKKERIAFNAGPGESRMSQK